MKSYLRPQILLFLIIAFTAAPAKAQDTTALIKEFNKIMSFTVKPNLYYSTVTETVTSMVKQPRDTATVTTEFYKYGGIIYSGNTYEMTFIDDSFAIQVNNERKSIWISKVNASTKEKMHVMPLDKKELQGIFRKNFIISKTESGNLVQLNFASRPTGRVSDVAISISVFYSKNNFLPERIETKVTRKQPIDSVMIKQLEKDGINLTNVIVTVDNVKYLLLNEKMTLHFGQINYSPEKARQIPSWKSVVDYNRAAGTFRGKGTYSDYEITKTF